jgi:hypothetical protein
MPDLERELTATIAEHADVVDAPTDLAARALAKGVARRRRRRLGLAGASLGCAAAAGIAAVVLLPGGKDGPATLRVAGPGHGSQPKHVQPKVDTGTTAAQRFVDQVAALLGPSFTPPPDGGSALSAAGSTVYRAKFTSSAGTVTVTRQDGAPALTADDLGPGTTSTTGADGSTIFTRTTSLGIVQIVVLTPSHRILNIVAQPASFPGKAPLDATRLTPIAQKLAALS